MHRELMIELFFFLNLTGFADIDLKRSRPRYTQNCKKHVEFRRICNERIWNSQYVLGSDYAKVCTGF